LPWLGRPGWAARLFLVGAGFLPVTLIAASTFGFVGLRDLATHILVPVGAVVVVLATRDRRIRTMIAGAISAGIVATALYDVVRFGFLWSHLMSHDPIPHIGVALHLYPAWVFGYLWRYLGNGGGLALAFLALGFKGVRAGVAYGLFVCAGLIVTLIISPNAQVVLFPLNATTVVMATIGHMVYGAVLGAITARRARSASLAGATVTALPAVESTAELVAAA
jgi:hypothetical protein